MIILINNETNEKITKKSCKLKVELFSKTKDLKIESLSIAFVDDKKIEELNNEYLSHEGPTDIITFDYSDEYSNGIDGEIVISTDTAKVQALEYGVDFDNEITRLIFHGLLHLSGLNDSTLEEKEIMKQNEDMLLSKFYN